MIKTTARSLDASAGINQAAQILNTPVPVNWGQYMNPPVTTGSTGQAQVGTTTLANIMASWSIPEQFRDQAIQSVRLLVLAAVEGSYTSQAFIFDITSGAPLSTVLVATNKLDVPTDPNSPVAVTYVIINSNAAVKQQYTSYNVRNCHRCIKCAWLSRCCCRTETKFSPRGNTPQELEIIKNKMKADQFLWFNQQSLTQMIKKSVSLQNNNVNQDHTLTKALEKYLSNNIVKAEILAPYNDSILSTLQSHIGSLKLASQSLKVSKIENENIQIILSTLAEDYDFPTDYIYLQLSQELDTGRVLYENLFTTLTDNYKRHISVKYIWILGQRIDNLTYSIHFLFINNTSQMLIDALIFNHTDTNVTNNIIQNNKQFKIVRKSTLNDYGEFLQENLLTMISPWKLQTTKIALNILRFTAASVFIPQRNRMLSYFDSFPVQSRIKRDTNDTSESQTITHKVTALSKAVSAAAGSWKDIVSAFKSSRSTTITRVTRFGFTHFSQKSTIMKAFDIPANLAREFVNALVIDFNLPSKGSFALGITYSDDFAWERIAYLYSPNMNGNYNSFTLFKNGDKSSNTASFFIIDINADWQLASDLLLIQTSKSYLGGLWESNKQSIQEVPHVLTLDEAIKLQQFFMLVAIGNLASTLRLNVTLPELN